MINPYLVIHPTGLIEHNRNEKRDSGPSPDTYAY